MKSLLKISFLSISLLCIVSCKVHGFSTPEYGKNESANQLKVKKVVNFRTFGGFKNSDGRTLKKDFFYRSGNLHNLKKKSFHTIEELGIKTIIDLRNAKEIAQKPDHLPKQIDYHKYSAFEDEGDQLTQARKLVLKGKVNASDADKRMLDFYREYVTENPEIIKQIINEILESDQPVLYHCTAGKDRTGIISALILEILNFDRKTIYNEYLLSNNYRENIIQKRLLLAKRLHFLYPKMDLEVLENLSWIKSAYLDAAFDEITAKYGSVEYYIENILEISKEKRQMYIEKFTYN